MTPAARVQTAIDLIDEILAGTAAEKTLTAWARRSRYAGSKDRRAVRDHVYDVLRRKNSLAQLGGGDSSRQLMIGLMREQGADLERIFDGSAYGSPALEGDELIETTNEGAIDLPDWLVPYMQRSLGDDFAKNEQCLRQRAPVNIRVNSKKGSVEDALQALESEQITCEPNPLSPTAFTAVVGGRKIANSVAYIDGLVELQDASSQFAVDSLPLKSGTKILDYCAGGGGKLLAMAGRVDAEFFAYDANAARMRDLPRRMQRAGVAAQILEQEDCIENAPYDVVFVDAPCSGTGAWRRDPAAKWRFSEADLEGLMNTQDEILAAAAPLVAPNGILAYATCSLLAEENADRVAAFIDQTPGWECSYSRQLTLFDGGDGFFIAHLTRKA